MSKFTIDINEIINTEIVQEGLATVRKKYLDSGIMDEEIFHELLQADPTPQKKYSDWAFKQIYLDFKNLDGRVDSSDDSIFDTIGELHQALTVFDQGLAKGFVTKKDINQYKSMRELFSVIGDIRGKESKNQKKKDKKYNDTEKVFEDDNYLIVNPQSWEACKEWGRGAQWCISYENSPQYWNLYTYEHRLKFYFVIDKREDSRHEPLGKVALGVDEMDDIQEAFDARDKEIYLEGFLDTLNSEGVPTEEIFTHYGWEEIVEADTEKAVGALQKEYDNEIENAELKHIDVYAYSDIYDIGITPEQSFSFSARLNIEIPDSIKILKSLNTISDEGLEYIKDAIEKHYVDSIESIDIDDDSKIYVDLNDEGGNELLDFLINLDDLESHYGEMHTYAMMILNSEGIIETDKYQKYIHTMKELDNAYENDKPFRDFRNISMTPYSDELGFEIEFNNFTITAKKGIERRINVGYGGKLQTDVVKHSAVFRSCVDGIIATASTDAHEYYNPNQKLFKDILPEPTKSFSDKELEEVRNILLESSASITLSLKPNREEYIIGGLIFIPPVGCDLELLFKVLEIVDNSYAKFNDFLVTDLNSIVRTSLFSNDDGNIKEDFNSLVDFINKWRL